MSYTYPWTRGRVLLHPLEHIYGSPIYAADVDALDQLWWMVEKFTSLEPMEHARTMYCMLASPERSTAHFLVHGEWDYARKTHSFVLEGRSAPETKARARVVQELAFAAVGRPTILPEPYLPPFEDLGPAPAPAAAAAAAADPAPVEVPMEMDDDSILDPVPGVSPAEEPEVEAPHVEVPRRQRRQITRIDSAIVRAGRRLADLPKRVRRQPSRLHF